MVINIDAYETVYTDTDIKLGTTYYYRIGAFNNNGESGYTETVSTATPPSP